MFLSTHSSHFFIKLIKKYENKSYRDRDGNTLAHLCVLYNQIDYLSRFNHDFKTQNKYGQTPYDLAFLLGRKVIHKEAPHIQTHTLKVFKTKEQVFETFSKEQIQEHFNIKYTDDLIYKNPRFLKWTTRKCYKLLQDTALKWKNHWTVCMHERDFREKKLPEVYIKWTNPLIGYGLFAGDDIAQYSYIGEYTGIVKKRQTKKDLENDYIFGYVTGPFETPFVIDARDMGNFTRFINHSETPNLFSTWMISGGICHIILFASRFIPKDAQLTYDYGPNYWKKRSAPLVL